VGHDVKDRPGGMIRVDYPGWVTTFTKEDRLALRIPQFPIKKESHGRRLSTFNIVSGIEHLQQIAKRYRKLLFRK